MIASRKSAIPELPVPYLDRPGLVQRLTEGLGTGKRITLVLAGPGMGKTALLAGYANRLHQEGAALTAWCDLARAARDAAVFCRRVHAALLREIPELSDQAVEVMATLGQAGLPQAMGLLCDDLEAALGGRAVLLVLDDAQHLPDDPGFLQGLEALIRYFPDEGQLVLAGRALPPLKLAQFELRGQVVRLGDEDLRFRPGEIATLADRFRDRALAPGGRGDDRAIGGEDARVGARTGDGDGERVGARASGGEDRAIARDRDDRAGDEGGANEDARAAGRGLEDQAASQDVALIDLAEKAQGWPAGIVHALATGTRAGGPDLLHAYLQEEVIYHLPDEVRDALALLAFLDDRRGEASLSALDPQEGDRLETEPALRPFLNSDGGGLVLRPLLREAMRRTVLESWPGPRRAALFRKLAECAADDADAIEFLQGAADWSGAESRLLRALPGLLAASRFGTVRDLLAAFPDDARRSAGLQYVAGELARREGRLDVAIRHLTEAERQTAGAYEAPERAGTVERSGTADPAHGPVTAKDAGAADATGKAATADAPGTTRMAGPDLAGAILAALAAAHGAMGDAARQRECAQRGLAILGNEDHASIGACYNALGMYHVYMQDLVAARDAFDHAMRHFRDAGDVSGQVRVQHNMGLAWSRAGDFARAISHYREAIRLAQAHHQLPLALTFNNLALCEIYLGRLQEAAKALEQGMALAERLMSLRDRSVLLRTMARLQMEAGSHEDARAFFESALDEAVAAGDRLARMYAHLGLAELHLREGRHREADAAVDHALEVADLPPGDPRTAEALVLRAMAAVQAGRPADAERFLGQSEEASAGLANHFSRFQIARLRAEAAVLAGNSSEAASYADQARSLAREFGYPLGSLIGLPGAGMAGTAGDPVRPTGAIGAPAAGGGASGHATSGTGASGHAAMSGPPAGTAPMPGPAPSSRTGFLGGPSAAICPPVIDALALGAFKVLVEGKPVPPGAWKIAKARIAMAYLLLHPAGATKDALLELLYPGEDPARTAVNMVLSRLRGALEPDSPRGAPSRFVLFQDGRYLLNQGVRTRFDVVDFRRLVKLSREPGIDVARRRAILDAAIALYQGPFMEGYEESAWIEIERENLRRLMKEACTDLMGLAAAEDDWKGLEAASDALLERDPTSQDGHRGRILALALQDRREDSLRACQVAEDLLTGPMRLELEPETAELIERVREDNLTIRAARSLLPAVS